jgi:Arc/MetJ-type ribon-helix-helix transcriptional regulator
MKAEYTERIAIRVAPEHKKKIQDMIANGKCKNSSELIRDALELFLKEA